MTLRDFTANGNRSSFERSRDLQLLAAPLLWIAGDHDLMPREWLDKYHRSTPGGDLVVIASAAHRTMVDQPGPYVNAIRAFLRTGDARK